MTWHIFGSNQNVKTSYDIKELIVPSEKWDGTEQKWESKQNII
jgi:hypothetical protein